MSGQEIFCAYCLIWAVSSAVCNIGRAVGDRQASDEEVASQVSLHLSYNNEFLCGGIILSPTEVVTVADKLYYSWGGVLPKIIIRIRAGRSNLEDASFEEHEVEDVFFHPNFNKKTMENNIAVLQTVEQFSFAGLSGEMNMEKIITNTNCSVTGWDKETMDVRIKDVNIVECGQVYSSYSGQCVKTIDVADILCKMSEGSSLICNNRLAALLSVPPNCNSTDQIAVFEIVSFAASSFGTTEATSASTSDVVVKTFRLWNIVTAIISFIISLVFQ